MRAENDLFLVRGSIELVFVWVVQIGSFYGRMRAGIDVSVSVDIDLVFVWVSKVTRSQCGGRN